MEGIILQTIPFEDYHRIITFFSPECGIIKVFVSNASSKLAQYSFLKPLSKVDILVNAGKKELFYYQDGHFIKNFIENPKNFDEILIATDLVKALLATQYTNKPSKEVYLLFEAFLTALPHFRIPESLLRSFQLKTLIYEGFLNLEDFSTKIPFDSVEKVLFDNLASVKTLSELESYELPKTLGLKIQALFDELIVL